MDHPVFCKGDKVCVLFNGRYTPFVVRNITQDSSGTYYYTGSEPNQPGPWYPEGQIDFDLEPEEKTVMLKAERILHAAQVAEKDLDTLAAEMSAGNYPKWMKDWFFKELGKISGWEKDLL